jgi:hypothetical protein
MHMTLDIGPARQISFVTRDIHASMAHFAANFGIGPWFYEPEITFKRNRFRGQDVNTVIAAGIAYSGPVQFELIQPLDGDPSIYKEALDINMWVDNLHASVQAAVGNGYVVVQESATGLGELYYLSHPNFPRVCLELSDLGPTKRAIFDRISAASLDWDGKDGIRKGFPLA